MSDIQRMLDNLMAQANTEKVRRIKATKLLVQIEAVALDELNRIENDGGMAGFAQRILELARKKTDD